MVRAFVRRRHPSGVARRLLFRPTHRRAGLQQAVLKTRTRCRGWLMMLLALCALLAVAGQPQRAAADPVFVSGITAQLLPIIRGIRQPQPNWCVPTVGYMMALYEQRHFAWSLLDPQKTVQQEIGIIAGNGFMNVAPDGATPAGAENGMQMVFKGFANGKPVQPTYPEATAELDEEPSWLEIKGLISEYSLPLMIMVGPLPGTQDTAGHAVFVFGYEVRTVNQQETDWLYLFDPFADASGADTSTQAKEWQIDPTTLKILDAFDALDNTITHLDVSGTPYKGRTIEAIVTGSSVPASVPEPSGVVVLLTSLPFLSALVAKNRRTAKRNQ